MSRTTHVQISSRANYWTYIQNNWTYIQNNWTYIQNNWTQI